MLRINRIQSGMLIHLLTVISAPALESLTVYRVDYSFEEHEDDDAQAPDAICQLLCSFADDAGQSIRRLSLRLDDIDFTVPTIITLLRKLPNLTTLRFFHMTQLGSVLKWMVSGRLCLQLEFLKLVRCPWTSLYESLRDLVLQSDRKPIGRLEISFSKLTQEQIDWLRGHVTTFDTCDDKIAKHRHHAHPPFI